MSVGHSTDAFYGLYRATHAIFLGPVAELARETAYAAVGRAERVWLVLRLFSTVARLKGRASKMRDMFAGYFRPSDEMLREAWSSSLLVLDANILLNLYRYSDSTRDQFVNVLRRTRDQLWLP